MKKCPVCDKEFERLLALSRRDNKTMICDECGRREALEDFMIHTTGANKGGSIRHRQ